MIKEKIWVATDKYFDAIVQTASEMIQIPSKSGEEKAMADYTIQKMKDLGYDEVTVDDYGNVIGLMKGQGGGKSIMFNCHLDIVDEGPHENWKYPPFSGAIAEGAIWGRGASDTKGTFAIHLYLPHILKQEGLMTKGDIYVVGVVHEEDAGFGSMMMAEYGFHTDYAVVGEASENDLAIACRGRVGIEVTISGKSCHASVPHEGVNPFSFLGGFLIGLNDYKVSKNPKYGQSLISATRISSSEPGTNVVPNSIRVSLDYRSVPGETNEQVIAQLNEIAARCAVPGVTVEIQPAYIPVSCYTGATGNGIMGEPPYSIDEDSETVIVAKAALENVFGRTIKTKPWAFATDSGHFSQLGIHVLGFSPAEIKKCHTVEDNIQLDMLKEGIAGNLALAKALCD